MDCRNLLLAVCVCLFVAAGSNAGLQRIGCFVDKASPRDLPLLKENSAITQEGCVKRCKSKGYKYAGLQKAKWCTCGNSYGRHGTASDSDCNMSCAGNKMQTCGAHARNEVFETGVSSPRCGRRVCRRNQKCVTRKSIRRIQSLSRSISSLRRSHKSRTVTAKRRHAASMRESRTPARYLGVQNKHACEGSYLSIRCPAKYVIQVLQGLYGRTSNKYCARGPRKTYNCRSSRANKIVASKCNKKRYCNVHSSNSVFSDPCRGTYKYMTVKYRCKLAASVVSRYARRRARLAGLHKRRLNARRLAHRRRVARLNRLLKQARRGSKKCV